jgi:hypothetical protein
VSFTLLFTATLIESAVQLEQFSDDIAVCNPIPAGRCVWHLLDQFDFLHQISVVPDGLSRDAGVFRKFGLVEFPIWGEIK